MRKIDLDLGDTRMIIRACKKRGLPLAQAAYVLATARWETNHTLEPVREAYWLSEGWRERNLRYYPWYGRGYVQLTWEENYARAGKILGCDLTTDPDAALQASVAADVIVAGMAEGWFTGKKMSTYLNGARKDYRNARRIVNGTDKAVEIAEIAEAYEQALKDDGYAAPFASKSPLWLWLYTTIMRRWRTK